MKVILVRDVARLGRRGEVKDVPDGHALNFLIPRKLGIIATEEQLRRLSVETKKHEANTVRADQAFETICTTLQNTPIVFATHANDQGHLFKGIHADDIAQHVQSTLSIPLEAQMISLDHPIKAVGTYTIALGSNGKRGECILEVVKQ